MNRTAVRKEVNMECACIHCNKVFAGRNSLSIRCRHQKTCYARRVRVRPPVIVAESSSTPNPPDSAASGSTPGPGGFTPVNQGSVRPTPPLDVPDLPELDFGGNDLEDLLSNLLPPVPTRAEAADIVRQAYSTRLSAVLFGESMFQLYPHWPRDLVLGIFDGCRLCRPCPATEGRDELNVIWIDWEGHAVFIGSCVYRSKHFTFKGYSVRRSVTVRKKTFCFQTFYVQKTFHKHFAFEWSYGFHSSEKRVLCVHKSVFNIHSTVSCSYVLRSKDILQLAIHWKAFSHSAFIRQPSFNILAFRGNAVRLFNKDGTFYKEHTFCAVLPFFEAISRSSRSVFLRYRIICNQAVQYSAIFCYMKVLCVQVRLATVAYLWVCRFILCVGTYEHVLRSDCFAVIYDCSCS